MACVFCEIAEGNASAVMIHEAESAVAFLPPAGWLAPGHTLVVPRAHVHDLLDCADEDLVATVRLVKRVSEAMVGALGAGGVNVLNASGPHSEQSVFHLHFHVVPRWEGDGFTTWPLGRSSHQPIDSLPKLLSEWMST